MALISWQVIVGIIVAAVALLIVALKTRYHVYTPNEFVLHIRRGKVKRKQRGGSVFLIPIFDKVVVLSTAIQTVDISASEKVISKENQDIIVRGFIVWRIIDPEAAFATIGYTGADPMKEINHTLEQIVESVIRTTVANMTLDQTLRERDLIVRKIVGELQDVVDTWGLQIETVEIRDVEIKNEELFRNMQAEFVNRKRLEASEIRIKTEQKVKQLEIDKELQIAEKQAEAEKYKRVYMAQQEEEARARELEKDKLIVQKQQEVELADQLRRQQVELAAQEREKQVGELARQKEIEFTKLEQQKEIEKAQLAKKATEIQAETLLIKIKKEAEAEKARKVLTEIEVEAERKRRDAAAQAEAIKIQAEAEAEKLRVIAQATKEKMLAEAQGKKAILEAEAEGLKKKVEAQKDISEAMILHDLIFQLPSIAENIKVGEVNWLSMGDKDSSPMGIIPQNVMQLMAVARSFGLDIPQLLQKVKQNEGKEEEVTSPSS